MRPPFLLHRSLIALSCALLAATGCVSFEPRERTPTPPPTARAAATPLLPDANRPPPPRVSPTAIPSPATAVVRPSPLTTPLLSPSAPASPPATIAPQPTATEVPLSCQLPDPAATVAPDQTPAPDLRLTAARGVATPAPYVALQAREDAALEARIRAALGDDVDEYGVMVEDLRTGRAAMVNGDKVFYAASVFKLFVMYEVFHQASLGLLSLDDELVMTPYYDSFGLGPRATRLCQRLTIGDALEAMMAISDNAAAVLLQDRVGSGNINAALGALGIHDSGLFPDDLPLTADDAARLLEAIARGEAVSREASQQMIDLMSDEEFDNGLRAGTPASVQVAHKTGNWPNATNDAGIVFAPEGSYVIVVLTDLGYSTKGTQAVAATVYDYLSTTH